jgi:opacity protein-like surface antigen
MNKQGNLSTITNIIAMLGLLLITSTQVKAELITEVYGGEGFTQKHNAHVNLPDAGITGTHKALKFDSAATVGGRAIYWINTLPYLGLGLDASHFFGPDQEKQTSLTQLCIAGFGCSTSPEKIKKFNNNVTVIGLDIMLRYPLFVSDQFTKGRLQPYLSVGPAAFITTLKDTDNFIPAGQSSTYTSLGVKAGAGLMLFFTKSIGGFIEYRNTNFQVKDQYNNATIVNNITLGKTLGNATFNIQTLLGGVSLCF